MAPAAPKNPAARTQPVTLAACTLSPMALALSSSSLIAFSARPKRVDQEPGKDKRAGNGKRKRKIIEEQPDIAEGRRRIGGEHTGACPDPGNAGRNLPRGEPEPERADGEIMPAHRQHERAEQPGDKGARRRSCRQPERKPGQELGCVEHELSAASLRLGVEPDIVEEPDLDDGRD